MQLVIRNTVTVAIVVGDDTAILRRTGSDGAAREKRNKRSDNLEAHRSKETQDQRPRPTVRAAASWTNSWLDVYSSFSDCIICSMYWARDDSCRSTSPGVLVEMPVSK